MDLRRLLGGCVLPFVAAVAFDVVGLVLLFVGIFANLRVDGRFYGDFLIYSGALVVFFSLGFWLLWFVGNIQVREDDGGSKKKSSIAQLARKLSERLSQKLRGQEGGSAVGKAGRVTWGKSVAYCNGGYEDGPEGPAAESTEEKEGTGEGTGDVWIAAL